MRTRFLVLAVAALLAAVVAVGVAVAVTPRDSNRLDELGDDVVLATVDSSGGLCLVGETRHAVLCEDRAAITASTVTVRVGDRHDSRPLTAAEREQLSAAIGEFEPDSLQPFTDTCPVAYDGSKSVYTFHGAEGSFDSCRWDLAHVRAAVVASAIVQRGWK